ncbi:hypothetical protein PG997_009115 [Apiospora hydei]|uniref:Uncharacterized protein n=1 Tax=Apiospora hydei TaxID=1337664 RepID=A0ABR1VUF6_9PEZI
MSANTNTNDEPDQRPVSPAHSDDDKEQSAYEPATPVDYSQLEINRDDDMELFIENAMTPNASGDATMSEETGWSLILRFRQLALEEREQEESNTSGEESATTSEEADEKKEEGGQKKPVSQPATTDNNSYPHLTAQRLHLLLSRAHLRSRQATIARETSPPGKEN